MRQKRLFALIMPLLCALILASCSSTVSQEDYAALTAERDALYAKEEPRCRPLSPVDAQFQRLLFQRSYAKRRDQC